MLLKVVEATGRFEVASRLQQRTTAIMRYAVQSGLIDYNPAQEMAGAVASSNRIHRPALELNAYLNYSTESTVTQDDL